VGCLNRRAGDFCIPSFVDSRRKARERVKMSFVTLLFLFLPGECVMHPEIICDLE
jgi:hypothetical protein